MDYHALCAELVRIADALNGKTPLVANQGQPIDGLTALANFRGLADRARAALAAATVAEKPSDEELLELARAELNNSPNWEEPEYDANNPFPYEAPGIAWLNFARAVLARYGHQPAPPAEGEVADEARYLARELHDQADDMSPALELFGLMHRAADLLEQRHPAPVPVSERLPGPEDCDGEGRYWGLIAGCEAWVLGRGNPHTLTITHWLPATAVPLPAGEVQP